MIQRAGKPDPTKGIDWTRVADVSDEDIGQDFVEDVVKNRAENESDDDRDGKPA